MKMKVGDLTQIEDGLRGDDGRMINESLGLRKRGGQRVSERTAAYVQSPRY